MKKLTDFAVDILRELLKIPTVNPPGENYKEMALFLKSVLRDIGMNVALIEIPEEFLDKNYIYSPLHKGFPRFIVLGEYGEGKTLHFNGHYDVVPPGEGWDTPPFEPVLKGNRIYGRGSNDMKGGIAVIISSIKHAIEKSLIKDYRVEVCFVPDEESGGTGTKYFIEEVRGRPDFVIIGEPTGSGKVSIGHKGFVRGVVKVKGKQGHASKPWKAINAFEKACFLVSDFLPEYQDSIKRLKTNYPVEEEEERNPTISLGGFVYSSVKKENVVPGEFIFSFDRRTIPEENLEEVEENLKSFLYSSAETIGVDIEVEIKSAIESSFVEENNFIVKFIKDVVERTLGIKPILKLNSGRYDLVYYRRVGIPGVVYGPGVKGKSHAINEYNDISEIEKTLKVYTRVFEEFKNLTRREAK